MDTFTSVAGRPTLPLAVGVPAALPTGSKVVRVASTAGTTRSGSARTTPLCVAAAAWTLGVFARRRRSSRHRSRQLQCRWPARPTVAASATEADVVVIGSGLGGLTCAGVLAAAGKSVIVLESHYKAGGAAHTFAAKAKGVDGKFYFDSGPSLYGGLSEMESSSPVKHVFQIIGEEPEWIKYDRWNAFIPEGEANAAIGYEEFVSKILPQFGGPSAKEQWDRLMRQLMPLAEAVVNGPPPSAVREDLGALLTLGRYAGKLKAVPGGPQKLSEPFSDFLSNAGVTDPFIRNWMDMFAFLLQGLPSYGAPTSMMAYMMADLYRKNTCLDFPKGGNEAMVDALVRGVEKHEGCQVMLRSHVEELLVKGGRAAGVRLRSGETVLAREAVVSNADYRVTRGLVPDGSAPELEKYLDESWQKFPQLRSFIHIHLGFKGDGLPSQHCPEFPAQWGVFNEWTDLEAKRNAVLVSCPSMLDPDLAPLGYHALHAYTPAHALNAAALGVGIVKCGLTGLAPATSYAFAVHAPLGAKGGLGLMQPVLVAGDAAAIWAHGGIPSRADLSLISGLLLHTLVGLAAGYALLDIVSDSLVKRLLGAAILVTFLRRCANYLKIPGFGHGGQAGTKGHSWHSSVLTAALGAACGMVSVLTNNSGLLLDAYLIGLKLPKQRFLSMRSSYLLVAGLMKLVGHLGFGVLPLTALPHATWLCLLAIVGVLVGKQLVKLIPQVAFDLVVSSFVLCGALRLVVWG